MSKCQMCQTIRRFLLLVVSGGLVALAGTLLKWDIYLVLLSAIVVATLAGKWLWDK